MGIPIQSLRFALGACVAAAGVAGAAASLAVAQERPYTPALPQANQDAPPPIPILPVPREDRIEATRPPDCLSCMPPPPRPSVITNPSWARPPQPEYPAAAIAAKVAEGQATVRCTVTSAGALSDCAVTETPGGYGFGEAALASTGRARISPRTVDGAAVNARVTFTIRFRMPGEDLPAPVPVR